MDQQSSRPEPANGHIITFYSYKGGTGRSMAMANLAWILAANRKKVFVIDWDLEAPGLHRYFRPFLIDKELVSSNGLIDVVHSYVEETIDRLSSEPDAFADADAVTQWADSFADIAKEAISLEFKFPGEGYIDFLPAGRQIAAYAERVNTFNWHDFYKQFGGGEFLEAVKRRLRMQYDYILIDSRTGVSDTSGISTVQMPDILAVCFTYNNQSISGAAAIAESVRDARMQPGAAPFRVFPIPTRVEPSERNKLIVRQNHARRRFEKLIDHIEPDVRMKYWTDVEIPYIPFHAYEETLAVLTDNPNDAKQILKSLLHLTSYLTGGLVSAYQIRIPDETLNAILKEFFEANRLEGAADPNVPVEEIDTDKGPTPLDIVAQADLSMAGFNESDALGARKLWLKLVSVRESRAGFLLSSWPVEEKMLPDEQRRIASALIQAGMLRRFDLGGTALIEIAHDALLRRWETLNAWVKEDRAFLEWRVQLTEARQRWENNGTPTRLLLTGAVLDNGTTWVKSRRLDLTDADLVYFEKSRQRTNYKIRVFGVTMAALAFCVTVIAFSYAYFQKQSANVAQENLQLAYSRLRDAQVVRPVASRDSTVKWPDAAQSAAIESVILQSAPVLPATSADSDENTTTRGIAPATQTALGAEANRRAAIELTYFAKASDPPDTAPMLSKLGYKVSLGASSLLLPTNTIWFGCASALTSRDARNIASLLIHEGVALRKLQTFSGPNGNKALVHIGASKWNVKVAPLGDAEVAAFDLDATCGRHPDAASAYSALK